MRVHACKQNQRFRVVLIISLGSTITAKPWLNNSYAPAPAALAPAMLGYSVSVHETVDDSPADHTDPFIWINSKTRILFLIHIHFAKMINTTYTICTCLRFSFFQKAESPNTVGKSRHMCHSQTASYAPLYCFPSKLQAAGIVTICL